MLATDRTRTKLRVKLSHDQNRDNVEFYLHCKFQSLPFCVRRRNGVTDRKSTKGADASVIACMQLADAYDSTYATMHTVDPWKHQNYGSMQAAELWKHASSRTMVACKQQNHGSMQTALRTMEAWKQQN